MISPIDQPKIPDITYPSAAEMEMTDQIKWEIARTCAHLHLNGRYTGISVNLKMWSVVEEGVMERLNLPPLPKKGG